MAKLNEPLLKETLIGILETCHAQFVVTSRISSELDVLMKKAREHDPDLDLSLALKKAEQKRQDALREGVQQFEKRIQQLRDYLIQ